MSHIVLRDVRKTYRMGNNLITALDGVSLEIEAGQLTVVLGPSGSGKTTLLNLLGGLESPDSGSVRVGDQDIAGLKNGKLTAYRRHNVGFVFQFFNLLPTLTALENVALSAEMADGYAYGRAHDPAEMLARVGLGDRTDHYPGQLSGGQQQRVAVARALAKNPALVLADEPTGSLDVQTGIDVLKVMRALNRETGQTFVLVTHNSAIAGIADRVIRVGSGKVQNIINNPDPFEPDEIEW
ncbi:MAG: ABC transporter ATP-binding protein [Anaerolineae bacterium]|nr:ABC transporter ATP-binding protein [Anaerolineae bacterium]